MAKLNFTKLKPKGLEKHKVKWQTKTDLRLRSKQENPDVKLNLGDYWNRIVAWLEGFAIDVGTGVVKNIVPGYFYIALIVLIGLVLIIKL
jgi:hypothetical protein